MPTQRTTSKLEFELKKSSSRFLRLGTTMPLLLSQSMEHNILQNNAIDMYQTYYSDVPSIPPVENSTCHTVNVYREPGAKRAVRSLSWQSDGGARFAAAHADVNLMRTTRLPQYSYIWDIGT